MRFQILSHAGLMVECEGTQIVCDPWIVGSCYWRSWWNYPPVSEDLVSALRPDYIYLTHLHWDHFQSASLKRFDLNTPIIIPFDHHDRFKTDLRCIGFNNIIQIRHGASLNLNENFKITSYQFDLVTDSAIVLSGDGVTLFNANDAKFIGLPLKQILDNHPQIDFLFRSHSSANERLCYECTDKPGELQDDISVYANTFCKFIKKVNPAYVIPFASNCCHLHKDSMKFNQYSQTPKVVEEIFNNYRVKENLKTELRVMVSGDYWDSHDGFHINDNDYFSNKSERIEKYLEENKSKLADYYAKEDRTLITLAMVERYFNRFIDSLPFLIRRYYKGKNILFVLNSGNKSKQFLIDIYRNRVSEVQVPAEGRYPIQFITSAYVMRHAMAMKIVSFIGISKRVKMIAKECDLKFLKLFNELVKFYEYDLFPISNALCAKKFKVYGPRWREWLLYCQLIWHLLLGSSLIELEGKYLEV